MDYSEIIIRIPTDWENRTDAVVSIYNNSDGVYMFAGLLLMNTETKDVFKANVHEDNIWKRFVADEKKFAADELKLLKEHTHVFYLIGNGNSDDSAKKLMNAISAILNAGGIAVKDETTGRSYSKEEWARLTTQNENIWA